MCSCAVQFPYFPTIQCEGLLKGLKCLKPYHTFLLLVERAELLHSLSPDASPALWRLLHVEESHLTPFFTLAADADLTLTQVFMVSALQQVT